MVIQLLNLSFYRQNKINKRRSNYFIVYNELNRDFISHNLKKGMVLLPYMSLRRRWHIFKVYDGIVLILYFYLRKIS